MGDKKASLLETVPWNYRLGIFGAGSWNNVLYDRLERDILWVKYGIALSFVTLEFDDIEMERGFQADMARRRLGNGDDMLRRSALKMSINFISIVLCAALFTWIKYTLWHPCHTCFHRLGSRDITYDKYLCRWIEWRLISSNLKFDIFKFTQINRSTRLKIVRTRM